MLKNAALIVKIGVDTAENEPQKEGCVVADRGGADRIAAAELVRLHEVREAGHLRERPSLLGARERGGQRGLTA